MADSVEERKNSRKKAVEDTKEDPEPPSKRIRKISTSEASNGEEGGREEEEEVVGPLPTQATLSDSDKKTISMDCKVKSFFLIYVIFKTANPLL